MRKGVQKGMGDKAILPIDSTCIIRNNVLLPKTNKLFSQINAKYLIIVKIFLLLNATL